MQFVCKDCFNDQELIGFITSQDTIGSCSFCGSNEVEVISIEELLEFFKELLENFQPVAKGEHLISKVQTNWSFFSSLETGNRILNFVLDIIDSPIKSSEELVDFNDEILENVNFWFKLKEQLKWERRYLTDVGYLIELGWDSFFESKTVVREEDIFYRARLHKNADEESFSSEEMLCPPRRIATAGRANSSGIPYLYLSDNAETVLYEIRASYLDEVSVASFRVQKDLASSIIISDFTEIPSLYAPDEVNQRIKATLLKQLISLDLSRPMRRYDSEIDYIPTQFICEFIKVFTNVKGIKFKSSLHPIGNNLVIFDEDIMESVEVRKVQVSRVEIDSIEI